MGARKRAFVFDASAFVAGVDPPAEVAHRSITICHLGNIAMQLGIDGFKWDPDKEQIVDNPEAARLLSRAYRQPWGLHSTALS